MSRAKQLVSFLEPVEEAKPKAGEIIKELIDTDFSGSNDEQGKAVQLMRGLAFSDDPVSNKFMKALDKFTSSLDPKDFMGGSDDFE